MANLNEQHIDRLISGLYEAATTEGLWVAWLASTAKFFGRDSGLSVVQDKVSRQSRAPGFTPLAALTAGTLPRGLRRVMP